MTGADGWDLRPGDTLERREVQARFGGKPRARVTSGSSTPDAMLFLDPAAEEAAGLVCGMHGDGLLHAAGEGSDGDQLPRIGNRTLLDASSPGRAVRVFAPAAGGRVAYQGRFTVDGDEPCYAEDAPDPGIPGAARVVIVFRLASSGPTAGLIPPTSLAVSPTPPSRILPAPLRGVRPGTAALLADYAAAASGQGMWLERRAVLPPGGRVPLAAAVLMPGDAALVAVRPSASRDAMRGALGELDDLARMVPARSRVVLVPSRPRPDLLDLAEGRGAGIAWPGHFAAGADASRRASRSGNPVG